MKITNWEEKQKHLKDNKKYKPTLRHLQDKLKHEEGCLKYHLESDAKRLQEYGSIPSWFRDISGWYQKRVDKLKKQIGEFKK